MKVGIVGGGQLGRMLALAGYPLGLSFVFLDPSEHPPAHSLGEHRRAPFDAESIAELLSSVDWLTWEFENVPPHVLTQCELNSQVRPSGRALAISQDRLLEKQFFQGIGARVPRYAAVHSVEELAAALTVIGYPAILKTRRLGYDGKGQLRIPSTEWLSQEDNHRQAASVMESPCILEEFVSFEREVSCIAARDPQGSIAWYPLTHNIHRNGILFRSAPLPDTDPLYASLTTEAQAIMEKALVALSYIGVMAIEFFEKGGELWINECAPRVHNSGHWTTEGSQTSQFENHLRAICGLPLGSTELRSQAIAMRNIIGASPDIRALLSLKGVHLHQYGKEVRAGRKVGHVTIVAESYEKLAEIEAAPVFDTLFA